MYSDKRMSVWWDDNSLDYTINKYKKKGPLKSNMFDPIGLLQHLDSNKDDLHYGVRMYLNQLYQDLNGVGHPALFKEKDIRHNLAVTAAKKAAEEKNKQQKRMAAAAERKATEQEGKLLEERQRLEDEAAKRSQQQLKLANFVKAKEEQAAKAKEEQKRLAEEAEKRRRQAAKQKEEAARIEEEQRQLAEEKERNRRKPPSQLQVTINEPLRDKIYQQLAMVAGTDTSQLESYVPKEILELTDEEEENQWNAKKDAAAKFAITSVIEKLDEDGSAIDADEKAEITDFFTCLMENNYVFDMGFRVDYGNNSVRCWCPCW